ncbi:Nucleotide-binding alpha-beta plait [Pyrenophora seminiperda CCB06]|uniref:Nucleotide-binding alpha-beta plait n=1 Tax=Pyrenophora seminiperda CCB06 TaxID=1302712 RepID=A0A3M7MAR3_9PLEO|nr:Nucleotide-binding alpha-beta plait [Pyrenophora seminiperda CCB06]
MANGMPAEKVTFEDNMSNTSSNVSDGDNDLMEVADDPDDGDFRLDDYEGLGIPSGNIQQEEGDEELEYEDAVTGTKRKHALPGSMSKMAIVPRRSLQLSQAIDDNTFILEENNDFLNKPTSRVPGTFGRHDRRKGESLPAYHKRVSHELDSDDELMMQMRKHGYSDRQIAEKLAKDGRIRYDQKSISTRIMRIRLAQADNVDFLLREGYKEWEIDDDKLLVQAYALADIETNYEVERVRAWRFRKVSDYMRRLNPEALFSATACRERYNSLMTSVAQIPTEEDDDPNTRRVELETYRTRREQIRTEEKAERDAKEAAEAKAKHEARSRNAQKAEESASKNALMEADKAKRAMARAASAQMRANRALQNSAAKTERNTQIKKQKRSQEPKEPAATPKKTPTFTLPSAKYATKDTPDPRSYLSVDDLVQLCDDRGIDLPGRKNMETLVQALRDADDEYSQKELQIMCRHEHLAANVSKMTMKYQLALAAAKGCASFGPGVALAGGEEANETDGDEEMDIDVE